MVCKELKKLKSGSYFYFSNPAVYGVTTQTLYRKCDFDRRLKRYRCKFETFIFDGGTICGGGESFIHGDNIVYPVEI
jgi:hypothetical protein